MDKKTINIDGEQIEIQTTVYNGTHWRVSGGGHETICNDPDLGFHDVLRKIVKSRGMRLSEWYDPDGRYYANISPEYPLSRHEYEELES